MLPNATSLIVNLFSTLTKMLPSKYFSTGGDEINVPCYVSLLDHCEEGHADRLPDLQTSDNVTEAYLNSTGQTFEEALSNFTVATHNALAANGKTPVSHASQNVPSSDSCDLLDGVGRDGRCTERHSAERYPSHRLYVHVAWHTVQHGSQSHPRDLIRIRSRRCEERLQHHPCQSSVILS